MSGIVLFSRENASGIADRLRAGASGTSLTLSARQFIAAIVLMANTCIALPVQDAPTVRPVSIKGTPGHPAVLTNIDEIKKLLPSEARQKFRVRLKAVVTYFDAASDDLFIQDKTGGIWVMWDESKPKARIGELLDLSGFSNQIDFAPEIIAPTWTVLGHAKLPSPKKLTYKDLVNTSKDSTWVEAEGVVRQISYMPLIPHGMGLLMTVALTGSIGHLDVQIPWDGSPVPTQFVDARVQILGVCGAEFNATHQQIGGVVYSPALRFIKVLEPAPKDQFAQATDLIARLQTFGYQRPFEHRVKLSGIVTAVPQKVGFYIQDSSGGIYVESRQADQVRPGDRVETLGFLKVYQSHLQLENAILRPLGRGVKLVPSNISVQEELAGKPDSRLVAITGKIIGHSNVGSMSAILLEQAAVTFPVVVGEHDPALSLPSGTLVRAVGVSSDEWDFFGRVTAFKILARSPSDITVLRREPWWSIWYLVIVLAILGTITLLISVWVVVLRRRVRQQTNLISQKLAQEEMLRAEAQLANKAKGEFLANMSHEIRTPMNGVLGMTEAALETELTLEQREYLEIAKSSAHTLLTVVNDILDFSKIEAGKLDVDPAPADLRHCLSTILRTLAFRATDKNLELLCHIAAEVPRTIVVDAARLSQILLNLIGNAIKFTQSGEVELDVGVEESSGDRRLLHFCVRDTGIGIHESRHNAIFEAFSQADNSTTRRFGGTGLGLTISSRLVALMGGRIWVESQFGVGSQFHFTIDVQLSDSANLEECSPALDAAGLRILIVDDHPRSREILRQMADSLKMQTAAASSAYEALVALRTAARQNEGFDLLVLDEHMPGMDGFALLDELKQDHRLWPIPVLLLCLPRHHESPARREAIEGLSFLVKPIFTFQFANGVREALKNEALKNEALGHQAIALPPLRPRREQTLNTEQTSLRLLLAEDNAVNQKVTSRLLEKLGHQVTIVSNGFEALQTATNQPFDAILMDIQMPEMDGLEATAAIRKLETHVGGHVTIIALTAHAMAGDRERCIGAGMDGYLTKPIQSAELIREISRLRNRKREIDPDGHTSISA